MKLGELEKFLEKPPVEIIVLFATLFLYILSDTLLTDDSDLVFLRYLFAILVIGEMLFILGAEVKQNTKKHGWKHEVVDTIVALLVALGIWFGAIFLLNTSSPISGVVSCSMLPNLYRGDFVVVQGADPLAYHINMSKNDFQSFENDYSLVFQSNISYTVPGSLYSYCLFHPDENLCRGFASNPRGFTELRGPLTYKYDMCTITTKDGLRQELATIRERGYAFDLAEEAEGVHCASAPILNQQGVAVAALTTTGPAFRMVESALNGVGKCVKKHADTVSRRLGYGLV